VLDHDRVGALGDDARAVEAQARELAKDAGGVRAGRSDPAECGTVHHQFDVLVEHLAPCIEVTVVETLVEAGDERSEVHGVLMFPREDFCKTWSFLTERIEQLHREHTDEIDAGEN
jgi:hypothetical protein